MKFFQMCHSPFFTNSAMILFLNKKDRFAEKLARSPLHLYFPEYEGSDEFKDASKYIWGLFMECRGEKVPTYLNILVSKFQLQWLSYHVISIKVSMVMRYHVQKVPCRKGTYLPTYTHTYFKHQNFNCNDCHTVS